MPCSPRNRVEVSTLVGARTDGDLRDDIIDFPDDANSGTFGGTWVLYSHGDLGVSGTVKNQSREWAASQQSCRTPSHAVSARRGHPRTLSLTPGHFETWCNKQSDTATR